MLPEQNTDRYMWRAGEREMDSSCCMGVMAVVAVSGSVALLTLQMHKRLGDEFRRRAELELGGGGRDHRRCKKAITKKKVRFADDVVEPSSDNHNYRRRRRHYSRPAGACISPAT